MKHILTIALILGLTNSLLSQEKLVDSKTLQRTFSETEIQDLQMLFDFFNQTICSDSAQQDLTNCYHDFFKRLEKSEGMADIELHIPFDKQLKVYDRFSDSTFSEIWSFGKSWGHDNTPTDTFKYVYFNPMGEYLEFLRRTGRQDKMIKSYHESVTAAGDIPPSLIAGLIVKHNNLNIEDIRVKLIVAIHYLTLNDKWDRKEKINKNSG